MNNQILIDSSFLFAIFHSRDKNHLRAVEFNAKTTNAPLVPDITLPEVSFLFVRDLGYYSIGEFLAGLIATQIPLIGLNMIDIQRAHEIMKTYPDAKFDLVDTCIMRFLNDCGSPKSVLLTGEILAFFVLNIVKIWSCCPD